MWHHVMNRGSNRRRLFRDDEDYETYIDLVGQCGPRWNVWTAALCLMANHYHLLVHDESGQLSRAMRHIDGVYTQYVNRKHGRDGALMRGRFRSRVVQQETYVAEVVRYIHANPVAAGLVERAADHRWSSHRAYLDIEPMPQVRMDEVAELMGIDGPAGRDAFDAFVHERADREVREIFASERWSPIVGDDSFVERCRRRVRHHPAWSAPDVTTGHRLARLTVKDVLHVAEREFGLTRAQITRGKRGSRNTARLLTLQACRDRTGARLAIVGAVFGVKTSTVAQLSRRARTLVAEVPEVAAEAARLDAALRRHLEE